jgi:hypothetical protein
VRYVFFDMSFLTVATFIGGSQCWEEIEDFSHYHLDWLKLLVSSTDHPEFQFSATPTKIKTDQRPPPPTVTGLSLPKAQHKHHPECPAVVRCGKILLTE